MPVPIADAADASLAVEERRPLTSQVRLLADLEIDLRAYAMPEGSLPMFERGSSACSTIATRRRAHGARQRAFNSD